ncbi:MAG TPA: sulfurtransferase TusA family protein [Methylothermaceae bacterium]|nr:sulfurtransferase TusA family protein [Methylothermaceae bacterium]
MKRTVVDARGLLCPLPVIRLQDAARRLAPGTEVELIGTDPGILHDVPAWCRIHGHRILETFHDREEYRIVLRIGT